MGKNNKPYTIEYVKEQFEKKDYTLLSDVYKNKNKKLDYICNKHKDIGVQKVSFASFLTNIHNCSICKSESNSINWYKNRNFVPIDSEDFYNKHFEKYKKKLFDTVGTEYELLNVFKKSNRTYMKLKHSNCGTIYDVETNHFFSRGQRCPYKECNSQIRKNAYIKPVSQLKEEVYNLVGDEYELVGEYSGTNNNMIFRHRICGNYFQKTPHNFFSRSKMPSLCFAN